MSISSRLKILIGLAVTSLAPMVASADLPPGSPITFPQIDSIIQIIVRFMFLTSITVAFIFIVWNGIMIMTAQGDPKRYQSGMTGVKNAAIGIGVVLAVNVIINTVGSIVDRSFFCQISLLGVCLY